MVSRVYAHPGHSPKVYISDVSQDYIEKIRMSQRQLGSQFNLFYKTDIRQIFFWIVVVIVSLFGWSQAFLLNNGKWQSTYFKSFEQRYETNKPNSYISFLRAFFVLIGVIITFYTLFELNYTLIIKPEVFNFWTGIVMVVIAAGKIIKEGHALKSSALMNDPISEKGDLDNYVRSGMLLRYIVWDMFSWLSLLLVLAVIMIFTSILTVIVIGIIYLIAHNIGFIWIKNIIENRGLARVVFNTVKRPWIKQVQLLNTIALIAMILLPFIWAYLYNRGINT